MSRKGIPTKPNKTDKATAADTVFTKNTTAKWIVDYFKPQILNRRTEPFSFLFCAVGNKKIKL